jgi:hypothetical protein
MVRVRVVLFCEFYVAPESEKPIFIKGIGELSLVEEHIQT